MCYYTLAQLEETDPGHVSLSHVGRGVDGTQRELERTQYRYIPLHMYVSLCRFDGTQRELERIASLSRSLLP